MSNQVDFTEAVDAHYERVYRMARVMTGDDHDALDLTQETFLEALRGFATFRNQSAICTWLIGILRHRFLTLLRKRRRPEPLESSDLTEEAAPEPPEEPLDIGPALQKLSEPVRTTLVMFYYEEMDYASIARALDCPMGTVRSRLHQGREQLRKLLAPQVLERTP
ncbi:MAG TPA: sigma-70 family RNA polymerase sigma factor [Planctomycetota bacterium]